MKKNAASFRTIVSFKKYARLALLCIPVISFAQKDIVISDSLAANSEKMNVKMGGQGFGKMWKMRFGDYGVVSSKAAWTSTSTRSNFFNSKTESRSVTKFSFVLTNKSNDSAKVNAANNIETQSLHEIEILPHFSWGNNELQKESRIFSAFIDINSDTADTWALLMNISRGSNTASTYTAVLTNGDRTIVIDPASSNKNGTDSRAIPAMGYEFLENGKPVAALQFYGGGALGLNKNAIWIHTHLDSKMKLILAAATTAILQVKATSMVDGG